MTCRVGIIGSGSFGAKRARGVMESRGELVAVGDANPAAAEACARSFGVRALPVGALLADDGIDAVIVAVPNRWHAELTLAALEAGKHVLCEKPLAPSSADAERMVAAAARCQRFLKTGSNHRYFASVRQARALVDEGEIGPVRSFFGRIGNDGERIARSWFWDRDTAGGGTLLDNGCHMLDLARWFVGDLDAGTGVVSNSHWLDCPVEDTAAGVFVNRQSGALATVMASWRLLSGYFHFEINGADGYIAVDGRFDAHGGDRIYWRHKRGAIRSVDYAHVKPDSYSLELDHFFDCIARGVAPEPTGEDGLAVVRMVEAVYAGSRAAQDRGGAPVAR